MFKKCIFGVCGAAIIALAAVNLNLAFKGGDGANLSLAKLFSIANNESEVDRMCKQEYSYQEFTGGAEEKWWCERGPNPVCVVGLNVYICTIPPIGPNPPPVICSLVKGESGGGFVNCDFP